MVHYQSGAGPGSLSPMLCVCDLFVSVEELAERSEEAQDTNLSPVVTAFDTLRTRHLQAVLLGRGWACVGGLQCHTKDFSCDARFMTPLAFTYVARPCFHGRLLRLALRRSFVTFATP